MRTLVKSAHRAIPVLMAAAFLAAAPGCGEEPKGIAVTGAVTLDGKPLEKGEVTLRPLGEGPAVSGTIADGAFRFDPAQGPAAGPYVVEINAVRPTGKKVKHPDLPGETLELTKNLIPTRYNRDSDLKVDILATGENKFDFDVRTR